VHGRANGAGHQDVRLDLLEPECSEHLVWRYSDLASDERRAVEIGSGGARWNDWLAHAALAHKSSFSEDDGSGEADAVVGVTGMIGIDSLELRSATVWVGSL
jgi:hypothetical protein